MVYHVARNSYNIYLFDAIHTLDSIIIALDRYIACI